MKFFVAGIEAYYPQLAEIQNLSVLVSYWAIRKNPDRLFQTCKSSHWEIFLDSGAFSALTLGAQISIDEYIEFIQEHSGQFKYIASLDVIGDARSTLKNWEYMRKKGIEAIPTFHISSDMKHLRTLAKNSPLIALGVGGQQRKAKAVIAWIRNCFREAQKVNPEIKIHGFALTSYRLIRYFPWYSVDSTTWINVIKFGEIIVHTRAGLKRVRRMNPDFKLELIRTMRNALTKHEPIEDLFIEANNTVERMAPALRYHVRVFVDYCARIDKIREGMKI